MGDTVFYPKLMDEYQTGRLFTPGNRFCFEAGNKKIMYVALDPRQKPPENGLFTPQWISVEDALPPPAECQTYLVRVRSGGPDYGGWDYDYDIATWGYVKYLKTGLETYEWTSIVCDWDGEVSITHWMPLPDPPEEV